MGGHLSHLQHEPMEDLFEATCGPIYGNLYKHDQKEVMGFLNIPYAKPPVGDLRFKKSEPAERWTEPRHCHLPGPIAPQTGGLGEYCENRRPEWDEANCLHLNVFAPRRRSEEFPNGYPVMVFLHGGGFEFSSAVDYDPYSMSGTLPLKDIVLITVNYRLGALGFLTTGTDSCRGNYGLWDQKLALEWIQEHIASFGGDPRNVTVFGQSAGGASADLLSLSPHSRDLFHKMILMSGTAYCEFAMRTENEQVNVFREFAIHHGYSGNDPESLFEWYQQQPAEVLTNIAHFKMSNSGWLHFIPNLDGDFFPKPLEELRAEAPHKPVMLGVCEYEGLILGLKSKSADRVKEAMQNVLTAVFREDVVANPHRVQQRLLDHYTSGVDDNENALNIRKALLIGDLLFTVGVQLTAESAARAGHPVFLYSFDYCNPNPGHFGLFENLLPIKAPTHFTDIRYVLGEGLYSKFEPDDDDLKMMDRMTTIYSNFAKFGDPNGRKTSIGWEKFSIEHPDMHFKLSLAKCEMKDKWQEGRHQVLKEIIENEIKYQSIALGK
uniref:Carboxylic ester hydrolase n=1 Tax=Caenorhabditis japonica TaxID=281687 RepID=A0A8R1I3U1_CAEJA